MLLALGAWGWAGGQFKSLDVRDLQQEERSQPEAIALSDQRRF